MKKSQRQLLPIIIILYIVSGYLIINPLIPSLKSKITQSLDQTKGYKYSSNYISDKIAELDIPEDQLKSIPEENTLVIPKIGVDGQIYEGQSESTLSKGIWRRPNTSKPGSPSNIVLAAHRYLDITAPNSFYNLDKLELNDEIIIFWEGKEHVYKIDEKKIVPATALEIENPTPQEKLTLYTCEPLYSAKNRLVITAAPLEQTVDKSTPPLDDELSAQSN